MPLGIAGQGSPPITIETVGVVPPARVAESSGVAASRKHPGLLWTHNDSGDGPFLFLLTLTGEMRATFRVDDARAVDWEDIALGPCTAGGGACLYIADTGDNAQRRSHAVVYVVPEPDSLPEQPSDTALVLGSSRIAVRYADGAQDVESIAVAPNGVILLVTRGRSGPPKLYRVVVPADSSDPAPLQPSDELHIALYDQSVRRLATGAAFSPSGEWLAVRTYTEIFFYRWIDGRAVFVPPICQLGFREPQGEAVDFLDEDTLVLTSEARGTFRGPITVVSCLHAEHAAP